MRILLLAAISVALARPPVQPPPVWGANGHMAVAQVAWAILGKDAKGQAVQDAIEKILAIADQRALLGGLRLAELLNKDLN